MNIAIKCYEVDKGFFFGFEYSTSTAGAVQQPQEICGGGARGKNSWPEVC